MIRNETTTDHNGWRILPEIDGLRSIAVIPVLLFHFDRVLAPGGFVGVDIFFVISGFLITAILLQDLDANQFSLAKFYQRRIARIAPAFFLVLIVTIITAFFVYSHQDLSSTGANGAFAALSLANVKFMLQGNYFAISPDAQPSLHYWSLSVEEQFYIFFPLYLYGVVRFTRKAVWITSVLALGSFLLCIFVTRSNPTWAFYLLPTRAWELLVGSTVALVFTRNDAKRGTSPNLFSTIGILLVFVAIFITAEGSNFPGWIAAVPVVGTAMILMAAGHGGIINRVLANKILVFVGKRSYSLYLWHWPVYSLVDYQFFGVDSVYRNIAKIGLTVLASLITYEILERPARQFLNITQNRKFAFGGFVVVSAMIVAAGIYLRTTYYLDANPGDIATGGVSVHGGDNATIVLIGDSEAAMYGTELAAIARSKGYKLHVLASPANNELPGESGTLWPAVESFVQKTRPSVIVITEAWGAKMGEQPTSITEALNAFRGIAPVILLTQPPEPPELASRKGIRDGAKGPFFETQEKHNKRVKANDMIAALADQQVIVIDVAPIFLDADGSVRVIDTSGRMMFQDPTHLSSFGAVLVRPALETAITAAIGRTSR